MWKIIRSLVHNAVKYYATNIVVEVNVETNKFAVIDNSNGVHEDVINLLRNQYKLENDEVLLNTSSQKTPEPKNFFLRSEFKAAVESCDKLTIETCADNHDAILVYENQQILEENHDLKAITRQNMGTSVFLESKLPLEDKNSFISIVRKDLEKLSIPYHSTISFTLIDKSTNVLVFKSNWFSNLADRASAINRTSTNNVFCVASAKDDILIELCFVCDETSNLKDTLFHNRRLDQDTGIVDFVRSRIPEDLRSAQIIGNIERDRNKCLDRVFQQCLEDCIASFLKHLRIQDKKYKMMDKMRDLDLLVPVVQNNTIEIDLTEDDPKEESGNPYFLDITDQNEEEFYDYVCSEAEWDSKDDQDLPRLYRGMVDVTKWIDSIDLPMDAANSHYALELIGNEGIDASFRRNKEALKQGIDVSRLNPSKIPVIKLRKDNPISNSIIDLINPAPSTSRTANSIGFYAKKSGSGFTPHSNLSMSHKKVFDKPIGESRCVFNQKTLSRNIELINKEAEKLKLEEQKLEKQKQLDYSYIMSIAQKNVPKKKIGDATCTKSRLLDLTLFDNKFKIPKKEQVDTNWSSAPFKKHSVLKQKTLSEKAESATSVHLDDIRKKAELKRARDSPDCSIVSWENDSNNNNKNSNSRKRKQNHDALDQADVELIDSYQVIPPPPKSPKKSHFSPLKRYNIFTNKNRMNQTFVSPTSDDDRPTILPTIPRRKTTGLKNFNRESSSQFQKSPEPRRDR